MNRVLKKLRDKRGSSMILALVFLLFCTFIGGSVLAMSAANSARIRDYGEQQQAFLDQRSAVLLLEDALTRQYRPAVGAPLTAPPQMRLTAHIITQTTQNTRIQNGGIMEAVGEPTKRIVFSFSAADVEESKPAMQRLVYESAILRVLNQYNYDPSLDTVKLEKMNFLALGGGSAESVTALSQFWLSAPENNALNVTLSEDAFAQGETVSLANVLCQGGGDPYHFWVSFGQDGGTAQVSLKMEAMVSERPAQLSAPQYVNERVEGGVTYVDAVTSSTQTVIISWSSPEIVKGGVS